MARLNNDAPTMSIKDALEYIIYAKAKGCNLTGAEDINTEKINIMLEK